MRYAVLSSFFSVQWLKETKGFTVCLNFMAVSWAELKTRTTFFQF